LHLVVPPTLLHPWSNARKGDRHVLRLPGTRFIPDRLLGPVSKGPSGPGGAGQPARRLVRRGHGPAHRRRLPRHARNVALRRATGPPSQFGLGESANQGPIAIVLVRNKIHVSQSDTQASHPAIPPLDDHFFATVSGPPRSRASISVTGSWSGGRHDGSPRMGPRASRVRWQRSIYANPRTQVPGPSK